MAKIFISHKQEHKDKALAMREYLITITDETGIQIHDVFVDVDIAIGTKWKEKLSSALFETDVVILLVTKDIVDSPWIHREVNWALATGITIFPVIIYPDDEKGAPDILDKFELELQFSRAFHTIKDPLERYQKLVDSLEAAVDATRKRQANLFGQLEAKWQALDKKNPKNQTPIPAEPQNRSYKYKKHNPYIHLALGDITKFENIDIIVNSENTYMQMARIYDRPSVSRTIRIQGAKWTNTGILVDDTIQNQLNQQITKTGGIPLKLASILVTSTGDKDSDLSKKGFHYVFHVAAVPAHPSLKMSLDEDSAKEVIYDIVKNCLTEADSLKKTDDSPIHSIIMPIFGSGSAGVPIHTAIHSTILGIKQFLDRNPYTEIQHIHLSAYTVGDAERLGAILAEEFDSA